MSEGKESKTRLVFHTHSHIFSCHPGETISRGSVSSKKNKELLPRVKERNFSQWP